MSDPVREHRSSASSSLKVAVLTVSDSRTLETDTSGALIEKSLVEAGHVVVERRIVPDEPEQIRGLTVRWASTSQVQVILITGGTGLSARDQTFETLSALLTKVIPGYGELFRMLSYQEIGPATILSRAVGGLIGQVAVFTMPGSRAAVALALNKILLPELPHIVREAERLS